MKKWFKMLLNWFLILAPIICVLLHYFPVNHYLFCLGFSLAPCWALAFIFMSLVQFKRKQAKMAFLYTVCAILITSLLPPLISASLPTAPNPNNQELKVMSINVLKHNRNFSEVIEFVNNEAPDLVGFQEVNKHWENALNTGLLKSYPFYYSLPKDNSYFGMSIYSKLPIEQVQNHQAEGFPAISGYLSFADELIYFINLHTIPPTTAKNYKNRNEQLQTAADKLSRINGPKLFFGDLNCVSWSPSLDSLKQQTKMEDSRNRLTATYPTFLPFPLIPIDHIFYSKDLACSGLQPIKLKGSDHRGVFAKFNFRKM